MKREIVLDTETTGMDPAKGDRVVEIGCLEVFNYVPTGKTFHVYLNPEREVPAEATAVHGLTNEFLKDKPKFLEVAADFLDFIGDAVLVAHNAGFDMKFLNAELKRCGYPAIAPERVVDTLVMARRQAPGASASLDALCRRYGIDNSNRTLHGALLDAQLLAEVYLELCGGRQPDLVLAEEVEVEEVVAEVSLPRTLRPARPHAASADELAAHAAFLKKIKDPIWQAPAE